MPLPLATASVRARTRASTSAASFSRAGRRVRLLSRRSRSRASARSTASSSIDALNARASAASTASSRRAWGIWTAFAQTAAPRFWWNEHPYSRPRLAPRDCAIRAPSHSAQYRNPVSRYSLSMSSRVGFATSRPFAVRAYTSRVAASRSAAARAVASSTTRAPGASTRSHSASGRRRTAAVPRRMTFWLRFQTATPRYVSLCRIERTDDGDHVAPRGDGTRSALSAWAIRTLLWPAADIW